jgi:hypothetical protein
MLSLVENVQSPRFPVHAASGDRPLAPGSPDRTTCVIDSASYQVLLAHLGLTPDPRLCVPAVHR